MILQLTNNKTITEFQGYRHNNDTDRCPEIIQQCSRSAHQLLVTSHQLSPACTSRHNTTRVTAPGSDAKVRQSAEKVKVTLLSTRAQSAKFYRTSYHSVYDNDPTDAALPAPR